jgi:hypothetical protein
MQEQYFYQSVNPKIIIFWDYVKYLFTPEDSQEFVLRDMDRSRYAKIGKTFFWFGMSVLAAFVIAGFFS